MTRRYDSLATTDAPPSPPTQDGLSLVLTAAMRYVLAGLAVLLVVTVGAWAIGASARSLIWALAAGILWSSLLLVLDFSRDPLSVEWQLWQARQAIAHAERLERDIAALTHDRDAALSDAAQARHAATAWQHEAQKGARNFVPASVPDSPEIRDAWRLVRRRYERAEPVSKEYMQTQYKWSADRYLRATGVLRERGYYSRNNQWKAFASAAEALAAFNGRTE